MNCENLQFNLSLYDDNNLTGGERGVLDAHLAQCPLCRQKLDDFRVLRNNLKNLARPQMPANLLASLRSAVAAELQTTSVFEQNTPVFRLETFASNYSFGDWVKANLTIYAFGTAASLIIGGFLLFAMMTAIQPDQQTKFVPLEPYSKQTIMLAGNTRRGETGDADLNATDYAQSRTAFASESPSVNPQGALVAMTKSFVRGKMRDDEVTVVADVLSSGLAQISEVVEPSRDRQAVSELENALKNNPEFAPPFVPARLDGRSDTVRVIFKIQTVNVKTNLKSKKS